MIRIRHPVKILIERPELCKKNVKVLYLNKLPDKKFRKL